VTPRFTRRRLFQAAAASGLLWSARSSLASAPFPVEFRKASPWDALRPQIDPGHDEFTVEKEAADITARWNRLLEDRSVPLAADFRGVSPLPARYKKIAEGVFEAEFDGAQRSFEAGLGSWIAKLGRIRSARFMVLARGRVRYEIASTADGLLSHRVGLWRQAWLNGKLSEFAPLEETLVTAPAPLFRDVTPELFGQSESFRKQLLHGTPYWRARLDSACGIDVYGSNGIAVGDIDGDGRDEVYVCQPAGLPNRLYKLDEDGAMQDVTERWGVAVLDDSTAALFLDLRNSGRQDLVVLTTGGPLLFLNDGTALRQKPEAFHFQTSPQGTFTGMAAADYDRDGRVDIYLCCYVYFQSEDQFRYPVPYHDARNGPPNFMFRNQLTADGGGYFEDVTAAVGLDENNHRYSFAPVWCDYDGDGWPDLYVANDFGKKNLYKNNQGLFRDVAAEAGVEDLGPGMSAAWFDYDGDAKPDLYVSNMWTASGQRIVSDPHFAPVAKNGFAEEYRRHTKGNSLYRNRGDGTFEEAGAREGVEMGRWAWSADGFDFNNDGAPEIYIACGMITNASETDTMSFFWRQLVANSPPTEAAAPAYETGWNAINQFIREDYSWNGHEPNVLYARYGGRYRDFSGVSGIDFAEDSRAFAVTDFDGDGNLDLFLKSRLGPQVRALRNDWGIGRHALSFHLTGAKSNRDAVGASVEVQHAGGRTVRFVQAGSGYLSQHTKTLHFGLGDSPLAEKIVIRWPSGATQEFHALAAGFRYFVNEGSSDLRREAFAARKPLPPAAPVVPDNRPPFEETWLLQPVPIPDDRKGPGFVLLTSGQETALPAGISGHVIDLTRESPDLAACYALFRRYLFDYRTSLLVPMLILIDERGLAHKVYPAVPSESRLREDLRLMRDRDRQRLALPFRGQYYNPPRRSYYRLGAAFFWADYPDQALVYLNEVIREEPGNGRTHLAIGHIHLEAGRDAPAREHLERAVQLLPGTPDAWNNLGSLELVAKNYRAALVDFEKATALDPAGPFALVGAGQAHAALGDDAAAELLFRRALASDPKHADAANQLGLIQVRHNRLDEARASFQLAIAAQRNHASAINNLGVLYMQMQKVDDAVAAFRYGIEVAPDDEMLYMNLARVYARAGDRPRARDVIQQWLARKPNSTVALKALRELGER
jgi:Flp pilus assembly protein TadD